MRPATSSCARRRPRGPLAAAKAAPAAAAGAAAAAVVPAVAPIAAAAVALAAAAPSAASAGGRGGRGRRLLRLLFFHLPLGLDLLGLVPPLHDGGLDRALVALEGLYERVQILPLVLGTGISELDRSIVE